MIKPVNIRVAAVLIGLAMSGCMVTGPTIQSFGTSHELVRVNQTLNPEASANLKTAEGLNGVAAQHATERYHKAFELAPTRPEFVLRVNNINQSAN